MAKQSTTINRNWILLIAIGGILLLAAAVLLALSANQNQPAQTNQQITSDPVAAVPRITLADAKAVFDQGSAIFLDVRTDQDYQLSHIPGAIHIPYNELPQRLNELDPAVEIITYCS